MLSRRIATVRPLRAVAPLARRTAIAQQQRRASAPAADGPDYPRLVSYFRVPYLEYTKSSHGPITDVVHYRPILKIPTW